MANDAQPQIVDQVSQAVGERTALNIIGGNSKSFYGRVQSGQPLEMARHNGIVSYEPTELVITVRAGTRIRDLQAVLSDENQMLGFEPTLCSPESTLGGVVAAGLAGPARAYSGGVRDFMLGVKMVNGHAQVLSFGGQVMKNVAGFDHARLMAGSMGTLGVLLEISLRVIPVPKFVTTVKIEQPDPDSAIKFINRLSGKPLPVSAAAWFQGHAYIRFSGTEQGVANAVRHLAADQETVDEDFFARLAHHDLDIFHNHSLLYRASVPATSPGFCPPRDQVIDWGGAQRWLVNVNDPGELKQHIRSSGGSLTVFRGGDRNGEVFDQRDAVTMKLYQKIKSAFDPRRIFNPGRMYKDL